MSSLKKNIISGTFWFAFGQLVSIVISLVTNIWLARLLSPKEFGQVGIVMFFIAISNLISEAGLAGSLVRKKSAFKIDYSTVFIFNLFLSVLCFILLISFSESIASYCNDILIKKLLIVSAFILIINAFHFAQDAKMMSELRFKQKSIYRLIAVFFASFIGLIAGYNGFGVWALVILQLLTAVFFTILIWVFEGFYFKIRFSIKSFKELYAFGVNTTIASLLSTGFDNIYQLILGKYFSLNQVGFFYQAKKLQEAPTGIIILLTHNVFFASLAKLQEDKKEFVRVFDKIVLMITVIVGLISALLYLYAENLIMLLYGSKWLGTVFYFQLLTISSFFYIQESFIRLIFKVFNKTRQLLYLEILKKSIQIISIILGIFYLDLRILIFGIVITSVINFGINFYFSRKKILHEVESNQMLNVIKISILVSILILVMININMVIGIKGYLTFVLLPIVFLGYFLILKIFKVFNFLNEIKELKMLYSNKQL